MTRVVWSAVGVMVLIAVAIVARRTAVLLTPSSSPPGFDFAFSLHATLTMVHILPGLLFMLLAPLQFMSGLRVRHPKLHRWVGRIAVACGAVIGVSALVMTTQMAIGGANETAATGVFGTLFLFAMAKTYLAARRREFRAHREWAIRFFAIGSAVTTTRPVMGMFFATSRVTHLTPHDFFGTAFWLAFTLHLVASQLWIDYTRQGALHPLSG